MTEQRLRLARTESVGPVTYQRLLARFGTPEDALRALPELSRTAGRPTPPTIPSLDTIRREIDAIDRLGACLLFIDDPHYPPMLRLLEAPPPVLSVLGDPWAFQDRAIALVGARNASANGRRMAEILATDLVAKGLIVVSGLARGIDAAAHEGALRGGRTIAAIAGGLDHPYPPENADLQSRIAAAGAVVAEAPLGTAPQARHFPRRNRIIAGLSLGVIVVEAAPRSGSLITARMAQQASRELFAVPGSPLDPRCRGSNDLIRSEGAHLTESAQDVIAVLDALRKPTGMAETQASYDPIPYDPGPEDLDVLRLNLLQLLSPTWVPVDDLVRRCHFSPSAVLGMLEELAAEGHVQQAGSQVCQVVP